MQPSTKLELTPQGFLTDTQASAFPPQSLPRHDLEGVDKMLLSPLRA